MRNPNENENITENDVAPVPVEGQTADSGETPEEQVARLREEYKQFGLEELNEEASMDAVMERLSTFEDEKRKERFAENAHKRASVRRRRLLIAVVAVLALAGLIVWFAFFRNSGKTDNAVNEQKQFTYTESDLLAATADEKAQGKCETVQNSLLYLFFPLEKTDISSISCHNPNGDYAFDLGEDGSFRIRGAEGISYNEDIFPYLLVAVGKVYALERVATDCQNFSEYGLNPDTDLMSFTVTTTKGVTHTVYLGDKTPTNAGYYARYEDRNAVYILSSSDLDMTVTCPVENLMSALLVYPVNTNEYYKLDNFTLTNHGKLLMKVKYLAQGERDALATTRVFKMTYPADYSLSVDNYDNAVLSVLCQLTGSKVVAYGLDDATLEKYGCKDPAHEITYQYSDDNGDWNIVLWISEKQEDGTYYVASPLVDIIATVDESTLQFLDWDLINFIDRPILARSITEIASISLQSDDNSTNANFSLTHNTGTDSTGTQSNQNDKMTVVEQNSGTTISNVMNFRYFYEVLLKINIEDYAPYTEKDVDQLSCALTVKLTTTVGREIEYKFYPYSTGRVLYTINGQGEFYIKRKAMMKLISDCDKVMKGMTVDPDAKS